MGSVRKFVSQCVSVSVCQCVSHQNFGLITTTKGLNASKRHSNNDNSEKKQCMVYLKVAEAVLFARISSYLWPLSRSQTAQLDTNQTGDETIVAEDTRS